MLFWAISNIHQILRLIKNFTKKKKKLALKFLTFTMSPDGYGYLFQTPQNWIVLWNFRNRKKNYLKTQKLKNHKKNYFYLFLKKCFIIFFFLQNSIEIENWIPFNDVTRIPTSDWKNYQVKQKQTICVVMMTGKIHLCNMLFAYLHICINTFKIELIAQP